MIHVTDMITDEDLTEIINQQIVKAKEGDLRSARFLFELLLEERETEVKNPHRADDYNLKLLTYAAEE